MPLILIIIVIVVLMILALLAVDYLEIGDKRLLGVLKALIIVAGIVMIALKAGLF